MNVAKVDFLRRLPKQLNTIITKVGDNYISLWRQCEAMWIIKLPVAIPLGTKLCDKTPLTREDLNTMIVSISDYDVSIVSHGHPCGSH